jgi:hypothetical protein
LGVEVKKPVLREGVAVFEEEGAVAGKACRVAGYVEEEGASCFFEKGSYRGR